MSYLTLGEGLLSLRRVANRSTVTGGVEYMCSILLLMTVLEICQNLVPHSVSLNM